jgi:RNA polymerase sigma-70 factor (ECF subfamily)
LKQAGRKDRLDNQQGGYQDAAIIMPDAEPFMESDIDLIESFNKGDQAAFETLYYRYRDWVSGLAWRFTANRQDSLDVLQETFAYLLAKFPGFNLSCSMTTFLYPVVKHLSFKVIEKNRRFASNTDQIPELLHPAANENQSTGHLTVDKRSELADVLKVLPDEQREVLLMRFVDDMSSQEIADALNVPLSTIKTRIHRALQTLRQDSRTRSYFLE